MDGAAIDLSTATAESFGPYVGGLFTVASTAGPVALRLHNVKVFEGSTVRDNRLVHGGREVPPRKAFALTFEGPVAPVLVSAQVALHHPALGVLALFLSPFRQDMDCVLYESVFN